MLAVMFIEEAVKNFFLPLQVTKIFIFRDICFDTKFFVSVLL